MEHPGYILHKLLLRLRKHFEGTQATRIQVGMLALFLACLWWAIGILAGSVFAFFVFLVTPDGPDRSSPALYVLVGATLSCGIFGIHQSWKPYFHKVSEIKNVAA